MKGDLTRATFRASRHFSGVRQQQGRVLLDADWNEQADIVSHRHHTTAADLIGPSGGPLHAAAFGVVAPASLPAPVQQLLTGAGVLPLAAGDVLLGAGRYYVDGILCEAESVVSFLHQPDAPGVAALPAGRHLLYLHVWERHLTWLDDPELREVALGGPDTATRARVVWQVGSLPVAAGDHCLSALPAWDDLVAPSTGTLGARARPDTGAAGPCAVAADAGYRLLENQLYRVEIHDPGGLNQATYKWSRDNGAVVASVELFDGQDLQVGDVGRDALLSFATGQWVELVHDGLELAGQPGTMFEIESVDPAAGVVRLASAPAPVAAELHPKLRRWESAGALTVRVPAGNGGWIALEGGVEIHFAAGTYRTGDYWQIPARTATGDVEWPRDGAGDGVPLPPAGIRRRYARLGVVDVAGNGAVTPVSDCRLLFPPVTELTDFAYLGGDGQEVMPNVTQPSTRVVLPSPLRVGVSNGRWPVQGARVRFEVLGGGAGLLTGGGSNFNVITVSTDANGVAEASWALHPTDTTHRVRATLRDAADQAVGMPIEFSANLSLATQVAYDPRTVCGTASPGVVTVQAAIDRLTRLTSLAYAGGDGQEAPPGQTLPQPLRVLIANQCGAVPSATVRFVADQGGRLAATLAGAASGAVQLDVTTGSDGVAQCFWLPVNDPARPTQAVTATLTAAAPGGVTLPLHPPTSTRFTARVLRAADVGYAPGGDCQALSGVTTVQAALDQLCAASSAPIERVRVSGVRMGTDPVQNDSTQSGLLLGQRGIDIVCDQDLDSTAGRRPICTLMLELPGLNPWDFNATDYGFFPVVLNATTSVSGNTIQWRPSGGTAAVLEQLRTRFSYTSILARLTVRGSFVNAANDFDRWLDGEVVEGRSTSGARSLLFPSGDGERGGTFEMWFWVFDLPPIIFFVPSLTGTEAATGTGELRLEEPAPEGGVTLRLSSSGDAVTDMPESVTIPAGETTATFEVTATPPPEGTRNVTFTAELQGAQIRRRVAVTREGPAPAAGAAPAAPRRTARRRPSGGTEPSGETDASGGTEESGGTDASGGTEPSGGTTARRRRPRPPA